MINGRKESAAGKDNRSLPGLCLHVWQISIVIAPDMRITLTQLTLTILLFTLSASVLAAENDSLETLAARIQVLEDREAIRQLIIDYGVYHDHRDYRSLSALFARNGVWESGMGRGEGPEGVFRLMDNAIGHNPLPEGSGTFHVLTNDAITVNGDSATALTKWLFITPGAEGAPSVQVLGHYNDDFIREDGEWKFLRREAPVDLPVTE